MKLTDILTEELVIPELKSGAKSGVLDEMTEYLRDKKVIIEENGVLQALLDREKLGSTGIGFNVAIPHAKVKQVKNITVLFGRSRAGIDFDSLDQEPVHLICLLVAPENSVGTHIKALARISRLLKDENLRQSLMKAGSSAEIYGIIQSRDDELE